MPEVKMFHNWVDVPSSDEPVLCVDDANGRICEAKLWDDETVLVRPVTPILYREIKKVTLEEFLTNFTQCLLSWDEVNAARSNPEDWGVN